MNHPRMNPEMKRSEYHLISSGPRLNISGFIFQFTTNASNINFNFIIAKIITFYFALTTVPYFLSEWHSVGTEDYSYICMKAVSWIS